MYTYLTPLRKKAQTLPLTVAVALPSARQARWLFLQPSAELTQEQQESLRLLCEHDPALHHVYEMLQRFTSMVRTLSADPLESWLEEVEASQFSELHPFARGIRQDLAAVAAGLSMPWSQGVVEGTVNKIKTHKRLMYGRASFKLLRQKILHQKVT